MKGSSASQVNPDCEAIYIFMSYHCEQQTTLVMKQHKGYKKSTKSNPYNYEK